MGIAIMGKVVVPAKMQSIFDLYEAEKGTRKFEDVRAVSVEDALVDTGATLLSMPKKFIEQLGLRRVRQRKARTSGGPVEFNIYDVVRLTVQGRECTVEVAELPDDCPVLIGQLPLEALDLVVDPVGQRLLGNPDHGGEHMIDMF